MKQRIYVAGPLFSTFERHNLEQIDLVLNQLGFETFLPHRDTGVAEFGREYALTQEQLTRIFERDVSALRSCDLVVAWLDGSPDQDSGTCIELGIAYERGMPIFGLRTDQRPFLNAMVSGVCGGEDQICHSIEELKARLTEWLGSTENPKWKA